MKTVQVGRFGKAHVWVDEGSGAVFEPLGVANRSVKPGTRPLGSTWVTVEAVVSRGSRSEYGLLGVTVTPEKGSGGLRLEVPRSESAGAAWRSPLVGSTELAHVGLPEEYVQAVLDGLDVAATGNVGPGILRVSEAVHGLIGSSPSFMGKLARVTVEIMLLDKPSEDELSEVLTRILLG